MVDRIHTATDTDGVAADAEDFIGQLLNGGPTPDAAPAMPATLAAALAAVQAHIPEVIKAEAVLNKDLTRRYTYADLSAVTRAILPMLGAVGLSWITKPTLRDGVFQLEYKLLHASGESEEGVYPLPVLADPQATGSAITYARRYCLCSVTGVAPGDDDDAAEATAGFRRNQQAQQEAPAKSGMSRFEQDAGLSFLAVPSAEAREMLSPPQMAAAFQQALDFRLCLDEHSAWYLLSDGKDSPEWAERFTARVADEIEAADTGEQCNALWSTLKAIQLDMTHDGKPFTQLIKERAAAIKERNAKALDTVAAQILAADLDDLEGTDPPPIMSVHAALNLGRITDQQAGELLQLASERLRRLQAESATLTNVSNAYDLADAEAQQAPFDAEHEAGFRAADQDGSTK